MGAAFLVAVFTTNGSPVERVLAGIVSAVGLFLLAGVLMLLWYSATAPAEMHRQQIRKRTALVRRLRARSRRRIALVFDPDSVKHVQPGHTYEYVDKMHVGGSQFLYALGVVNRSGHRLDQCRVVLDASEPHHTSQLRLERPLRPRAIPDVDGRFDVNMGDGVSPSAYVEVLEEWVPAEVTGAPSRLRMTYASKEQAKAFEIDRKGHVLCFRLETDESSAKCFVEIRYDADRNRWLVEPAEPRPLSSRLEDSSSRAPIISQGQAQ
jgi:hypothetical protein